MTGERIKKIEQPEIKKVQPKSLYNPLWRPQFHFYDIQHNWMYGGKFSLKSHNYLGLFHHP